MMPRRMALISIVFLSLVAMACSGTKGTPEPTAAAKTTATSVVATPPSGTSANTAQGAAAGAAAAAALHGRFCADWTQGSSKAPQVGGGAPAAGGSPVDFKAGVETTASFMKALADQAPAEVRPDFQVLAKFWSDYAAVMARNNYDFMRAATDPEFQQVAASGAEGLDKATSNIEAWMAKNCGR